MPPLANGTNRHAKMLRRNQTCAEQIVWFAVRNRRLAGFKFRRQVSIGPHVVDFLCVEARLVVELDGGQHESAPDPSRNAAIGGVGYDIIRFWHNAITSNLDGVLEVLVEALTQPSPRGRGL